MAIKRKEVQISIRLSKELVRDIERLADKWKVSRVEVIRQAIVRMIMD